MAYRGRKRKNTKRGQGKIEKRIKEVPETSIKQVQHGFVAETSKTVCRETMRKFMKMSAKPFKKTRAHFLSDLNWCLDMQHVRAAASDAHVFNENNTPATSCVLTSVWCDSMPHCSCTHGTIESRAVARSLSKPDIPSTKTRA